MSCGSVETEIRMFSAWLDPAGPPPLLCSLSQSALMPRIDLEKMLRPRRQYKIKKQTAPSSALLQLADTALMIAFKSGASFYSLLLSDTIILYRGGHRDLEKKILLFFAPIRKAHEYFLNLRRERSTIKMKHAPALPKLGLL